MPIESGRLLSRLERIRDRVHSIKDPVLLHELGELETELHPLFKEGR